VGPRNQVPKLDMTRLTPSRVLVGVGVTAATAVGLFAALRLIASDAVAGTLALGLGVALGVFIDRRLHQPAREPLREALLLGGATAAGWAVAQAILAFAA
jgi:hypothetical protein